MTSLSLEKLVTLQALTYGVLGFGNNQPADQVKQRAGHATREKEKHKGDPKPKRVNAKKFSEATAQTGYHTVLTAQFVFTLSHCSLSFKITSTIHCLLLRFLVTKVAKERIGNRATTNWERNELVVSFLSQFVVA